MAYFVHVAKHARRTGSPVAGRVLGHWKAMTSHWVKVMPRDYKRVLRELARRDEERPTTTVAG